MSINAALRSPAVQNLLAATVTGATVLARPARVPRWLRRGLTVANTAGSAGSLLMTPDSAVGEALGLKPTEGARNSVASAGTALAAATGGITLLTSTIGLKLDNAVEGYLVKKGVRHPRIWMAVGAVGLVFVVKTVQDAAAKKAAGAAESEKPATAPVARPQRAAVSQQARPAVGQTGASKTAPSGDTARAEGPTATTTGAATLADEPEAAPEAVRKASVAADAAGSMPTTGKDAAEPKDTEAQDDSDAGSGLTPTYDAMMATSDDSASAGVTPEGAADAPGATPAASADDSMSWTEVSESSDAAKRHTPSTAQESAAPQGAQADDSKDSAGKASAFEQQLADTTEREVDVPTPDDDATN